jgi:hypothetical protein
MFHCERLFRSIIEHAFFVKLPPACEVCYAENERRALHRCCSEEFMEDAAPAFPERERLIKLYREQVSQYKSVNAELTDLEWTLTDVERQITDLRTQIPTGGEAAALRRLNDLARWKNTLEEAVLQRLYRAEALATAVAELRTTLRDPVPEE